MKIHTPLELGHLVRESRRRLGLTQAGLAGLVGVSRRWIIDVESGKRTVDLSLVLRTLNALGIELDARTRATTTRAQATGIDRIVDASRRGKR